MYTTISTESQAESIITSDVPAWLFKHSQTCHISTAALEEFTRYLEAHPDQPAVMLVVQEHRPLSQWVAERLRYTHQSPQLFLLRKGRVVWSASHWGISVATMKDGYNTPLSSASRPAVKTTGGAL